MTIAPTQEPDIAIRSRPPSPKRLSRKVLLAGTAGAGAIVVFALLSGLSERPDRRGDAAEPPSPRRAGRQESIERASAQYDVADLPRAELDAFTSPLAAEDYCRRKTRSGLTRPRLARGKRQRTPRRQIHN
jgi:hypothetical protein